MSNFITNNGAKNLKKRLIELIGKSDELKFLVGFFYFSGISELYESLKAKNGEFVLKVLVGLNVDSLVSGLTVECDSGENKNKRVIEDSYFKSVKKSINNDKLDTKDFFEQVDFFIELIKKDKLIIRKTKDPNHAKLYFFELKDKTVLKSLFITGSSNLTKSGISTQNEFNVEIKDYGNEDAKKYFDNLWEDSVQITEIDSLKERLVDTIQNHTLIKKITPFQAFVVVLKTYLDSKGGSEISFSLKEVLKKSGYRAYKYQEDAVRQAVKIIEKYDGVIVADVVGLGKSVVASMIAKEIGKRGIVLCQPGLISAWEEYMENFELYPWKVLSSGNMDYVSDFIKKSKGTIDVIIVDEAHKFKNSDTINYEKLKNICREKKVILLSATPFNNSPEDILALLELFTIPKKSLITLDGNLKNIFKVFKSEFTKLSEINKYYKHSNPVKVNVAKKYYKDLFNEESINIDKVKQRTRELAIKIRSVIEPVTIRRNRLDLQNNPDYKEEVKDLSDIAPPKTWFYELTKEQSDFYDKVLNDYFSEDGRFTGAVYKPFVYESGKSEDDALDLEQNRQFQSQRNTVIFIKRHLVKRLESSFGSFEKSIDNFIFITEKILTFIDKNKKYILDRKLLEKIAEGDEDEVERALEEFAIKLAENNLPKNNKIYILDEKFEKPDEFVEDIKSDLLLYREIKKDLELLDMVKNDPKSAAIVDKIKGILSDKPEDGEPRRKILVFTEYKDTANFLEPILKKAFGEKLLYSGDLGPEKVNVINKNFDAAFVEKEQEDDYQILLATDKISEGFNLNRAGIVINYDIPWNPVRVIQRVGRINRISKKVFNILYIVNFFPSERGSDLVQTEAIAANKMFMIHNILGEDAKIFHADENPTPAALFERMAQDPDIEEESFETKVINKFREIKDKFPNLIEEINDYPSRIKISKSFSDKGLLVFSKRERLHIQKVTNIEDGKDIIQEVPLEQIYNEIYCSNVDLQSLKFSEKFWKNYSDANNFKERIFATGSQQSIEVKTSNFLNSIFESYDNRNLKDIAEILLEDMNDYGTLSLPTMRRIIETEKGSPEEILLEFQNIISDLGGIEYLDKIKEKIRDVKKEIVIAIENQ